MKTQTTQISNETLLPTKYGNFKCFVIRDLDTDKEHLVLYYGNVQIHNCIVRIHSECLTSEVFGSLKCDCAKQLSYGLKSIVKNGAGIFIYLRQEGRDIGLFNKIETYKLQEDGYDTVDANLHLGLPIDARTYEIAIIAINKLSPCSIKLMTNNPQKLSYLEEHLAIPVKPMKTGVYTNETNKRYLETKMSKLNHKIKF